MANPYTNGFDNAQVNTALLNRIAWQQPTAQGSPVLDNSILTSKSGRYFNDGSFHALLTVKNIKATLEDEAITDAQFSTYLTQLQKSAIVRALSKVFSEKEYFEQVLIYDRLGRQDSLITNSGLFVGYVIEVANDFGIAVQIDSVTLLFDTNQVFNLYIFKDGKTTPVWTKSVSAVANEATVVTLDDAILNYISATTKGNRFFFGYFQDDLGAAKAIREQADMNAGSCFRADPFSARKNGADFDRNGWSYGYLPFGLNLEMSSFSDHTQNIVKKASLFDNVVGLCMAQMVLEQILYTTRSNKTERILQGGITEAGLIQELKGVAPISDAPAVRTFGLGDRIDAALQQLKQAFYPKKKAQTINYAGYSAESGRY